MDMESDDDMEFKIFRPPEIILTEQPTTPCTPKRETSANLSKSLGLVTSPQSPCRIRSMKIHSPIPLTRAGKLGASFRASTPTHSPIHHVNSNHNIINPLDCTNSSSISSPKSGSSIELDLSDCSISNMTSSNAKPKLLDYTNYRRYAQEFIELEPIGFGGYGCVFKCKSVTNGVIYAIKKSLKPTRVRQTPFEACAHGLLEHTNIVRNYSSWIENNVIFMQNEYCNGGSLEDLILAKQPLDERQLKKVMEDVAQGLRYIHLKKLAHMDIKPGNILLHKTCRQFKKSSFSLDENETDEENEETVYKICDLGHVTRLQEQFDEEGDCRYLPREILNDYSRLDKVDIFALGLSLYEAAGGGPLPKNGKEWHSIRDGNIKTFPHLCSNFNNLLKQMIHLDPEKRPSADDILTQIECWRESSRSYKNVLDKDKHKIQLLTQFEGFVKSVKVVRDKTPINKLKKKDNCTQSLHKKERLIGQKSKRSMSTTLF